MELNKWYSIYIIWIASSSQLFTESGVHSCLHGAFPSVATPVKMSIFDIIRSIDIK